MKDILPELNGKKYIEVLSKEYDVRFCRVEEGNQLVEFLKNYWKKDHIFVLSRELFNWQHFDAVNKRYNYVVARHKKSGEFHSVLGFVPTSQFDINIKDMEIWPCIWKSRDDINFKGLGVSLYYYMKNNLPVETISILGISEMALSIYKHWNFETGKIKHYYMLNEKMDNYKLVSKYEDALKVSDSNFVDNGVIICECPLNEYLNLSDEVFEGISKYKSKDYYVNRFYKHPMYTYKLFTINKAGNAKGVLVTRECSAHNRKCLRVVDYIGRLQSIEGCKEELIKLIDDNNYEYIDFVEAGLNGESLKKAGFVDKKSSNIIVPNYYEPFYMQNIELDYAIKTVSVDVKKVFYKADADQDRPNIYQYNCME
ncbi:hypothetical protein [Clostridium sp.]|jgi:hypothetical protein|uniref:hypothetical protein n=1 Tax=Clostridium sp. TaxID=1506 RepID=UPI002FDDDEBB